MSRAEDAKKRAFLRWEFVRRNAEYQEAYWKLTSNVLEVVDPDLMDEKVVERFLLAFSIFPINPKFCYEDLIKRYKELIILNDSRSKESHMIFKKYLGLDWAEKNKILFKYECYKFRKEDKYLSEIKERLGKNWKTKISVINSEHNKAINEIGLIKNVQFDFEEKEYLNHALHNLSSIKLSTACLSISDVHSVVLRSYLTNDNSVSAYRFGKRIGLTDVSAGEGLNSLIDPYSNNLSRVSFELDLSYPTSQVIADVKREISKWKQVSKKYARLKQNRQNLFEKDVYKMLKIYDLRSSNKKYIDIAKNIFGNGGLEAIQRTRNMFNKAKRYIDGDYQQIR